MTLKEDYDYTCAHIHAHGSVLRCNRMFLQVKHASNAGGAVEERLKAKKGVKERENIAILQRKWPGVFRMNKNRKDSDSEVVMNWNNYGKTSAPPQGEAGKAKKVGTKVMKHKLKLKSIQANNNFALDAGVKYTKQGLASLNYINRRCARCHGKKVATCLGMKYKDAKGNEKTYNNADLQYDVKAGRLVVSTK